MRSFRAETVISLKDVDEALNKICDPDNICGMLLQSCRKQPAPILTHLFQLSIHTQTVPKSWKTA